MYPKQQTTVARFAPDRPISLRVILIHVICASIVFGSVVHGDDPHAVAPGALYVWAGEVEGWADERPFSSDNSLILTRDDGICVSNSQTLTMLGGRLDHGYISFWGFVDKNSVCTAAGTSVRFWDVNTSKLKSTTKILGESEIAPGFAMDPNGSKFVFTAFSNLKEAVVWKVGDDRPIGMLPHKQVVRQTTFDSSGKRIVTREVDKGEEVMDIGSLFHVWDTATCREVFPAMTSSYYFDGPFQAADFDPAGKRLVVAQGHGFTIVDAATGKTMIDHQWPADKGQPGELQTESLFFSPDGKLVIVTTVHGIDPGPVRIFDSATGKLLRSIGEHIYTTCTVSSDSQWLLADAVDTGPELWDIASGRKLQAFPGITCGSVSISPDRKTIAFGGRTTQIYRMREQFIKPRDGRSQVQPTLPDGSWDDP